MTMVVLFLALAVGYDEAGLAKLAEEHRQTVEKLDLSLLTDAKKIIADAVAADQFMMVEQYTAERTAFLERREMPASTKMRKICTDYLAKRKESFSMLRDAYKFAMMKAVDGGRLDEYNRLRDAYKGIESEEQPAPKTPLKAPSSLRDEANATLAYFEEFNKRFRDGLVTVMNMDTSVKRDEEHGNMLYRLDSELQQKRLTFLFPIENVTENDNGYALTLAAPSALKVFGYKHDKFVASLVYLQKRSALQLDRSHALAITTDDAFAVTGHGSFVAIGPNEQIPSYRKERFVFCVDSHLTKNRYAVYCTKFTEKIVRSNGAQINIK